MTAALGLHFQEPLSASSAVLLRGRGREDRESGPLAPQASGRGARPYGKSTKSFTHSFVNLSFTHLIPAVYLL